MTRVRVPGLPRKLLELAEIASEHGDHDKFARYVIAAQAILQLRESESKPRKQRKSRA